MKEKETNLKILRKNNLTFELGSVKSIKFEIPTLNEFKLYNKDDLPEENIGIYALIKQNYIFYIGSTVSIKKRLKDHNFVFLYDQYLFFPFKNKNWLRLYEKILIIKYKPLANKSEEYVNIRPSVLQNIREDNEEVIIK